MSISRTGLKKSIPTTQQYDSNNSNQPVAKGFAKYFITLCTFCRSWFVSLNPIFTIRLRIWHIHPINIIPTLGSSFEAIS